MRVDRQKEKVHWSECMVNMQGGLKNVSEGVGLVVKDLRHKLYNGLNDSSGAYIMPTASTICVLVVPTYPCTHILSFYPQSAR